MVLTGGSSRQVDRILWYTFSDIEYGKDSSITANPAKAGDAKPQTYSLAWGKGGWATEGSRGPSFGLSRGGHFSLLLSQYKEDQGGCEWKLPTRFEVPPQFESARAV